MFYELYLHFHFQYLVNYTEHLIESIINSVILGAVQVPSKDAWIKMSKLIKK